MLSISVTNLQTTIWLLYHKQQLGASKIGLGRTQCNGLYVFCCGVLETTQAGMSCSENLENKLECPVLKTWKQAGMSSAENNTFQKAKGN